MVEEIDYLLKAHQGLFEHIYSKYSAKEVSQDKNNVMSLTEFRRLCLDSKIINSEFTTREIDLCFSRAMMTQVDYLVKTRHLEMSFVEFLEAICRGANELSGETLK